jgi:hypothetical protein
MLKNLRLFLLNASVFGIIETIQMIWFLRKVIFITFADFWGNGLSKSFIKSATFNLILKT